jgi:predicted metalloprotease
MADWDEITSRGNVEDRRAFGPAAIGGGGLGLVGIIIVLAVNFLGGGNINTGTVNDILGQLQQNQAVQQQAGDASQFAGADQYETFASTVLGSNNDVWRGVFGQASKTYNEPKLVLFRGATQSACGGADSRVGPHYCPADNTIYLDETFFDELQRLGASGGDVAEAYVIAHEVGHHVQNELGIMDNIGQSNEDSIKLELQADCFAGVWASSVAHLGVFASGEINEAVDAAAAVGDDRIQQKVQGQITPETWTHGSSEQRVEWFNRGFDSGKASSCDTFRS